MSHFANDSLVPLLEALHDAVFVAAIDGTVVEANAAAHRMFDYPPGDLIGRARSELIDPSDPRWADAVRERTERGHFAGVVTCVRRGGPRFDASVTSSLVATPNGDRVWVVVHDPEQDRRAEQAHAALRTSEERFRALAEATFEGVLIHHNGTILLANRSAEVLSGATPGGMIGRNMVEFIAPESVEIVLARIRAGDERPYEGRARRLDGTTYPIEAQARQAWLHGEPVRVVALRDIEERRKLEANLAMADRMASIGTLAAGVAHEINNPLATLQLNLELALQHLQAADPNTPDALVVAHEVDEALRSAARVQQIVRDFRAMSRSDTQPPGPTDVHKAIEYAVGIARYQIRHRAELVLELAAVPIVRANESRLAQVVLNLLVNAVQAIPDGQRGSITVRARSAADGRVAIEVSDTGVGIPAEAVPHIFEPFFTTKPVGVGTGLGLAICYGIVSSFGGALEVETEVGRGTLIRVLLARFDAPAATTEPVGPTHAPSASARILVIDDEIALHSVCAQVLARHEVIAVGSAEAGLARVRAGQPFDAILCDLMMPGLGGAGFLAALERERPDLVDRLAFMTGGAVTAEADATLRRSAFPPLEKPFGVAALRARVAELLDRG